MKDFTQTTVFRLYVGKQKVAGWVVEGYSM